ncbi:MAG TPA: hypothetical protein VGJ58_06030 [Gaiellaceae bacterium]|jgi:hypothetical protein
MFRKLWEKLQGSSHAPDDLAIGTTRPGDFGEEPEEAKDYGGPLEPNPHEEEERARHRASDELATGEAHGTSGGAAMPPRVDDEHEEGTR